MSQGLNTFASEEKPTQEYSGNESQIPRDTNEKSRSKIRFNIEDVQVVEVSPRGMLTSADCRQIWYQPSDFSRISSLNRSTVKLMREFGFMDDDPDYCLRGLENKLHGESQHVKDIRINAVYAVLKEQSRQRKAKEKDEQRIADLYKEHAFSSVKKAQERGFDDARTAKHEECHNPNRKLHASISAFDDFDLKVLQDLDLHDDMDRFEWRMSELKTPKELYEERNGEKARRRPRNKTIGDWVSARSISPKRESAPGGSSRGKSSTSPKPIKSTDHDDGAMKPLRRVLSGGFSMILGGSNHDKSPRKSSKLSSSNHDKNKSSRERSPKPKSSKNSTDPTELPLDSRRSTSRLKELPLPGKRNLPPPKPNTGLRKIRSDMF